MSPSRTTEDTKWHVKPIVHDSSKLCKIGATITGLDLNSISDHDLQQLKEAIYTYKVIIIKGQHDLQPINQWNLMTRLDPTAKQMHGHGKVKDFQKTGGLLAKKPIVGIPGAENVRLIGKGFQGEESYGVRNHTADGASSDWHFQPPTAEALAAGNSQFQRWHMDAPLYEREPPRFTSLRAITMPSGPDLTVHWDDGSGLTMKTKPGNTAFFSNVQLYSMLSSEEKIIAENSWVEYAPFPYMWIENSKGCNNGLGLVTQGREHTMDKMPAWKEEFIKRYPCVWKTGSGEKTLQVHGIVVRKLFLKRSPEAEVEVIENLENIRSVLANWQKRILRPEYIFIPEAEVGDVQMWDNWAVFHSAIDYPLEYGSRTMHQANLGASEPPVGVIPIAA